MASAGAGGGASAAPAAAASLTSSSRLALGDGTAMPVIGFGTYQIKVADVKEPVTMALEAGYRHIDTAEAYKNEEGVGEALRDAIAKGTVTRDDVFITTKVWPGWPAIGSAAKSHEEVVAACKASVEKLGVDKVDLYLIHAPLAGGTETRLAQYRAVVQCQEAGLTTSIGVSNYGIKHLQEIEDAGLPLPAANQLELHPYCAKPEILAYMREKGIAPIAYSSLAPLSNWREGQQSAKGDDHRKAESPFAAVAERHGWSEAQLLLRWGLQRGFAILPKSVRKDRLEANFSLFEGDSLSADEMAALNGLDRNEALAFGKPGEPYDPVTAE